MDESVKLLDYKGEVDHKRIDLLLKKRVYGILVECLENISRHSEKRLPECIKYPPYVTVIKNKSRVFIRTGNLVTDEKAVFLSNRLDQINQVSKIELNKLFDEMINKVHETKVNTAGLGFMLMKIKSGNPIEYSLFKTDCRMILFEIRIKVNKYIMRKLIIEPTASSPKVIFDPDKNIFEISGESRPADVATFYEEIISWMNDYSQHIGKSPGYQDPVTINLDLEYFNSSSAKYLLDFCKQIGNARAKGNDIMVKWHYDDDDIDMLEVGREMSRLSKFPFEYIPKEIK
ncbi:MAG: DUF1987 domain-containing protein [Bacteroidia bacterium]|nr:DUF1987 domain-containing protein [Bacteroidia bacterium]